MNTPPSPTEPSEPRPGPGGSESFDSPGPGPPGPAETVRVSEVLSALSFALDLTEGQPFGHSLRSCLIGMRLGTALGLPVSDRRDLYYAMLLKDVGCSSNAARVYELFGGDDRSAKHDLKRVNWSNYFMAARYAVSHAAPGSSWFERARRLATLAGAGNKAACELVQTRCRRGEAIVLELGFGPAVGAAVRSLDEHWNGQGHPEGLRGREIPLLARIMSLAQTVEVFAALDGAKEAIAVAKSRRGTWFDPSLVTAVESMGSELQSWCQVDEWGLQQAVREVEPGDAALLAGAGTIDRIARGFAAVVDAKSPFTAEHSYRVTLIAVAIAGSLGFDPIEIRELRRAALLHDLGKLSVPNAILDKPSALSAQEWEIVRLHPYYTQRILDRVEGFQELAFVASSHHERLDGRGYFRGLRGNQLSLPARILAVADIFEALTADRPYRAALDPEVALRIMERDKGIGLGPEALEGLGLTIARGQIDQAREVA